MPAVQTTTEPTIHLQAIGTCRAKYARDIVAGDVLVWNYGMRSLVMGVREVSKCYIEITGRSEGASDSTWTRRLKKDRAVGYSQRPWGDK